MSKTKVDHTDFADDRDLYSGIDPAPRVAPRRPGAYFRPGHGRGVGPPRLPDQPWNPLPLLHGLEKKGYLRAAELRNGKSRRKVYRATRPGRNALRAATGKVRELFRELMEGE